jgi:hypothetical protein
MSLDPSQRPGILELRAGVIISTQLPGIMRKSTRSLLAHCISKMETNTPYL